MKIFSINQLEFEYPESKIKVLNNINLNIEEGEFVTLCGASGCGKSTLLRHLKSVLEPGCTRYKSNRMYAIHYAGLCKET